MPLDQIDVDELERQGEKEMSFFDHLEELRWHLVRSIASIFIFAIIIFWAGSWTFDSLLFAPKSPDFPTYRFLCWASEALGMGDLACISPPNLKIQRLQLEEEFMLHIKVAATLGFVVSFPYIFWEMWRFIAPGLKSSERKYTRGIVLSCSLLFFMGVLFGYYVVCPFALTFFANYSVSSQVETTIQITSFVDSVTRFSVPIGVVFELPVVVYFLSKLGMVTPELMKKYRKHAFVLLFIASAFITPPDVVSQILIGFPLYLLYEISIWVSARVVKKEKRKEELASYN